MKFRLSTVVLVIIIIFLPHVGTQAIDLEGDIGGKSIYVYQENICAIKNSVNVYPELCSEPLFLPLRVMCSYFGALIRWEGASKSVLIDYAATSATLAVGSKNAIINSSSVKLEYAPYINNGSMMVEHGFIEDFFNSKIDIDDEGKMTISSPPLFIDGVRVVSIQEMESGFISKRIIESKTGVCINRIYQFVQNVLVDEIPEPDYYGIQQGTDIHTYYYLARETRFMETAGLEGNVVRIYDIYERIADAPEMSGVMVQQGTDYGKFIIHDYTQDKWYNLSTNNFFSSYDHICATGEWEEIFHSSAG
jgi:hypothetical protein